MKAIDIYCQGQILCGNNANEEYLLKETGIDKVFFVNRALSDLKRDIIPNINCEISADTKTLDALICGVAYYLALKYNSNEKSAFLSDMYNSKRAIALSKISNIKCSRVFKQ